MLITLRRIIQEVNAAQNLPQALAIMVKRVKQAVAAETCSVFLADPHTRHFVLMASDGLNPAAIGVSMDSTRFARGRTEFLRSG